MARDDLRHRLRSILGEQGMLLPADDTQVLDDVIEEVLRATAADVAKTVMGWWKHRKGDET